MTNPRARITILERGELVRDISNEALMENSCGGHSIHDLISISPDVMADTLIESNQRRRPTRPSVRLKPIRNSSESGKETIMVPAI
jgi:hypothetical protein